MSVTIIEGAPEPPEQTLAAPKSSPGVAPGAKSSFVATVTAKGKTYSAWESISVQRDYKLGVSVFQFTPAEAAYGRNFAQMQLQPGDAVIVRLGGKQILNGYVTTRSVAYDAQSHQVVIAGKSKTLDAGESSIDIKPGTLNGNTFEQATKKVLQPHGVGLVLKNPPPIASKPFKFLMPQFGETGGEFISRIATQRGLFLSDDESGNLVADGGTTGGSAIAQLIEGKNILRLSGMLNDESSFGKFQTVSQTPGPGEDSVPRWHSATAADSNARANRKRLQIAEHPLEADELATRNGFEIANCLWEQVQVSVTVVGWFKPDGQLWAPGEKVVVVSPMMFPTAGGRYDNLAIQSVTFSQDAQNGTTTTLNLVLSNALTSIPSAGVGDLGSTGDAGNKQGGPEPESQPDAPDYTTT